MSVLLILGRIAFVLIFIASGTQKLMDVGGAAAMIAPNIVVPEPLSGLATQLEEITGMTTPEMLAMAAGIVELGGGLLIATNIGVRGAALLLLLFTGAATYWFHDFWNMEGADRVNNMIHAMKNLSMMGALLVFFVLGSWWPGEPAGHN